MHTYIISDENVIIEDNGLTFFNNQVLVTIFSYHCMKVVEKSSATKPDILGNA